MLLPVPRMVKASLDNVFEGGLTDGRRDFVLTLSSLFRIIITGAVDGLYASRRLTVNPAAVNAVVNRSAPNNTLACAPAETTTDTGFCGKAPVKKVTKEIKHMMYR